MAVEGAADQLLLEFGIDLTAAKQAAAALKSVLGDLNTLSDQVDTKTAATASASRDNMEAIKQASAEAIATAKAAIALEQQRQAELKTQTLELKLQQDQRKSDLIETQLQINAEKAKAEAAKAMVAQLRQQGIETREAAKSAAQAASAAQVARTNPSLIPIVRPSEDERVELPETFVPSILKAKDALDDVTSAGSKTTKQIEETGKTAVSSSNEATVAFKRLADAQLEVKLANAEVSKSFSNVMKGSVSDEVGNDRLAIALQRQAEANAELSKLQDTQDTDSISKTKAAEAKKTEARELGLNKRRIDAANISREITSIEVAAARSSSESEREALERLASGKRAVYQKMLAETEAYAKGESKIVLQNLAEEVAQAKKLASQLPRGGNVEDDASSFFNSKGTGIGKGRQEKDTIDALMGRQTIGPIDALISKVPGLAEGIGAVFPMVGAAAFVGILVEMFNTAKEFVDEMKLFGDSSKMAFADLNASGAKTNDELRKAIDNENNAIAKLEHKPTNNLAIAIDEARIKTDDLVKSMIAANKESANLLKDNAVARLGIKELVVGKGNTSEVSEYATNADRGLTMGIIEEQDKRQQANPQIDQRRRLGEDLQSKKITQDQYNAQVAPLDKQIADINGEADKIHQKFNADRLKAMDDMRRIITAAKMIQTDHTKAMKEDGPLGQLIDTVSNRLLYGGEDQRQVLNIAYGKLQQYQNMGDKESLDTELSTQTVKKGNLENRKTAGAEAGKLARERMAQEEAEAKARLAEQQEQIAASRQLEEQSYRDGEVGLKQHYTNMHVIALRDVAVKNTQAQEEYAARTKDINAQRSAGTITGPEANIQLGTASANRAHALAEAQIAYHKEVSDIDRTAAADSRAARITEINSELTLEQDRVRRLREIAEKRFTSGSITPDDYFRQQIGATQELAAAQIKAANDTYHAQGDTLKARGEMETKVRKAIAEAETSLSLIVETEAEKRLGYITREYAPRQQAIEAQMATNTGLRPNNPDAANTENSNLAAQMINSVKAQRSELEQAIQTAQPYSDTWFQIYSKIEQTYQTQVKYNQELIKMRDTLQPISSLLGGVSQSIGTLFHSNFGQNLSQVLGIGARSIGQAVQRGQTIGGRGGVEKDAATLKLETEASALFTKAGTSANTLQGPFTNLATAATAATKALSTLATNKSPESGEESANRLLADATNRGADGLSLESDDLSNYGVTDKNGDSTKTGGDDSDGSDSVGEFTSRILAAVGAVTDFASAITSAKSGLAGAVGGGSAGAGLGQTVSSALGIAGPFGAIAGAGVGAVLGGITGSKNAAVTKNIENLQKQYKDLMTSFSENTNNLQSTISQMQILISKAESMQASSKKGGSQYQQVIDQYTDELTSLQTQQKQVVDDMNKQLAILETPTNVQGYLSSLDDILTKYDKFVGAAKNATDLANANAFLTASIKAYSDTLSDQYAESNQTAIQDALSLNDLLQQRIDLVNNLNNQIRGVLTQGALTRQTSAQTKGQQIEQIEAAANKQLDQINQEIALTTYKVQSEQQIFNLASTRMGLEAQLLQLQTAQVDKSMAQISAMGQLISTMKAGNYNFTTLQALLDSLGYTQAAATAPVDTTVYSGLQSTVASALGTSVAGGQTYYQG